MNRNTLCKTERLRSKLIIEKMFAGGAKSFSMFPLRVVFIPLESLESSAAILISVSKRRFKQAVKRNRVKRQIREAYRKNKQYLLHTLEEKKLKLAIAFIYLDDKLITSVEMEKKIQIVLVRLVEQFP
ncbi:Ribonuclease P protein component [termite gut metagenome]|uniref:Ribonuclease P protein component n=1 Tax=termite gut metagenome TaxID=433724 RepID=A0A5J4REX6_9ZZZZ